MRAMQCPKAYSPSVVPGQLPNRFRDRIGIGDNFGVGEAQDKQPAFAEDTGTLGIILCLRVMDSSVHFDHQANGVTIKVCNETINHLLAVETQT